MGNLQTNTFENNNPDLRIMETSRVLISPADTKILPINLKKDVSQKNDLIIDEPNNDKYELEGKSFFIFGRDNRFRVFLQKVISLPYFERFIMLSIIASGILLIMKDPFKSSQSTYNQSLIVTDYVILVVYLLELAMKTIVNGFLFNGKNSFLRKFHNFLDFFLLVLTFVGTLSVSFNFSDVNLKPFRVFRFVKIVYLVPASKKSMQILILSVPELISVFIYFILNLLFFGIISMKYFKNSFYYCYGLDEGTLSFVKTKWDCLDYGGDWLNQDVNFDNIISSISALFQMSTTEGWMKIMFCFFVKQTYIKLLLKGFMDGIMLVKI